MLVLTAACKHVVGMEVFYCEFFTANIAATSDTMLQRWGLGNNRIHVVLRDNGRNINKALDEGNLLSLPCMAHTLQLVVTEGLLSQRSITDVVAQ